MSKEEPPDKNSSQVLTKKIFHCDEKDQRFFATSTNLNRFPLSSLVFAEEEVRVVAKKRVVEKLSRLSTRANLMT